MSPLMLLLAALIYIAIPLLRKKLRRYSDLPPGPKGHWLLGNTIPSVSVYRKFEEWTQEFGSVFAFRQGTKITIVIGRVDAAFDILDKESSNLSDRPASISIGETLSGGMRILFVPTGTRFRKMRRALHVYLQPKAVASYYPSLQRESHQHILDIIEDPAHHLEHAKRYSASVVLTTTYGKSTTSYQDPLIAAITRCLRVITMASAPGAWKVDAFPFLRYIPGYLRSLREAHVEELDLFRGQLNTVRQQMENHEDIPDSFGKYLIDRQPELHMSDDEIAYLAGSMFGAGSDSSAAAISVAVLAAACFPVAQARVQAELDAVVGRERPPRLGDREMLPQTVAFMLETFRWRPIAPMGVPHRAMKDIIWKNYRIPEGSTVIGNTWSIGRDPEVFPNPEHFDPQRFITADGKVREDLKLFTFGFGRRICPGQHLAVSSVFVNIALLHWAFKIREDATAPIDSNAFSAAAVSARPEAFAPIFSARIGDDFTLIRAMLEREGGRA
ncbi:cytochrome P450 [Mycena epipterygia]|nr:cytochrome P450 [Mycena epipterygia]